MSFELKGDHDCPTLPFEITISVTIQEILYVCNGHGTMKPTKRIQTWKRGYACECKRCRLLLCVTTLLSNICFD